MAAGRGRALCCRGAGLRARPERREEGSSRAREGRRGRGGGLEAEGRRDGEGPGGRRPQELERNKDAQLDLIKALAVQSQLSNCNQVKLVC